MRRLTFVVLVLIAAACASPRMRWPTSDAPGVVAQWPVGNGTMAPPPPPPPPTPCREVSRIPCDLAHCEGPGMDFVVIQCAGKPSTGRCEVNGGCAVKPKSDDAE